MKLPKRNYYSIVPFLISVILLIPLGKLGLYLIPFALLALQWYSFGLVYIFLLGILLAYPNNPGVYYLLTFSMAFLTVVSAKLDREKAPVSDYAVVTAAILLSLPTYYLLRVLSYALSGFEVTLLAVLLFASFYFFVKSFAS
jgi:hypothetical protein